MAAVARRATGSITGATFRAPKKRSLSRQGPEWGGAVRTGTPGTSRATSLERLLRRSASSMVLGIMSALSGAWFVRRTTGLARRRGGWGGAEKDGRHVHPCLVPHDMVGVLLECFLC